MTGRTKCEILEIYSKMVLFTAGDEDQFERKRSYKNGDKTPDKKVSLDGNIWTNLFVPTEGS